MNLPTAERHYLTREGDMVDEICWRYYGFTDIVTEAVYARNGFLSYENPLLPAMLLIVLPVVTEAQLGLNRTYWPSVERQLYLPGDTTGVIDPDLNGNRKVTDGCCADNPLVVDCAEWLAVYVPNDIGDWVLRRMHKSKINHTCYGYGYGDYGGTISTADINDPSLFL